MNENIIQNTSTEAASETVYFVHMSARMMNERLASCTRKLICEIYNTYRINSFIKSAYVPSGDEFIGATSCLRYKVFENIRRKNKYYDDI